MATDSPSAPALTLRALPFPAKLVASAFLISVGLGYLSALVQLHFQHSGGGEFMPTFDNVREIFAGVVPADARPKPGEQPARPMSQLERLIATDSGPWNGTGTMAPAFFEKSDDWKDAIRDKVEELNIPEVEEAKQRATELVRAEREGERKALLAWIADGADVGPYERDAFVVPGKLVITADYFDADKNAVKIKSILDARCGRCHAKDCEQEQYPLETYEQLQRYLKVPKPVMSSDGQLLAAKSGRQISVEKLTQSTHVHLLSFSMLYALTGLIFVFSSYPRWIRVLLGPLPLVAQVLDIACWWLARLDGVGPYFATAIVFTGGVVGVGLLLHIVLGLLNMYGGLGKAVLVLLFLVGAGGMGWVKTAFIDPQLQAEREQIAANKAVDKPKAAEPVKTEAPSKPKENAGEPVPPKTDLPDQKMPKFDK